MTVQKRRNNNRSEVVDPFEPIRTEPFSIEELPEHLREEMESALAQQQWPSQEEEAELEEDIEAEAAPIAGLPEEDSLAEYRLEILGKAAHIVTRDRNVQYGPPEHTFNMIAALWEAYLGTEILSTDVAAMMALMKIARLQANPLHEDSWVDLAGYAACGASNAKALLDQTRDE